MNVLSIQSSVCYGHVGNSVAGFILNRLGHEAWAVPTVQFSNHPGHGRFRGRAVPAAELAAVIDGLGDIGALARCDAVLTGYLGQAEQGAVVLEAVRRVRSANHNALWLCDPVIGDGGRIFVGPGIPELIRDLACPIADIVTPNAFELAYLTGHPVDTLAEAAAAMGLLARAGRGLPFRVVLSTGLALADVEPGITILAGDGRALWRVTTPAIAGPAPGAGDAFAALFLGHYLRRRDIASALGLAAAGVFAIVSAPRTAGVLDLSVVATQAEWAAPAQPILPERIA